MLEESKYMNQFNKTIYNKLEKLINTLPEQIIPDFRKKNIIYNDDFIWDPFMKYVGHNT